MSSALCPSLAEGAEISRGFTARETVREYAGVLGRAPSKYLDPAPPARRYEKPAPGMLLHLDIKKLGRIEKAGHRRTGDRTIRSRGAGWEYIFVAIDDHSRVAFSQILPDEGRDSPVAFLQAAHAYFKALGVSIQRVMTDNGSCFVSKRLAAANRALGMRHVRTRQYTPRTNGDDCPPSRVDASALGKPAPNRANMRAGTARRTLSCAQLASRPWFQ